MQTHTVQKAESSSARTNDAASESLGSATLSGQSPHLSRPLEMGDGEISIAGKTEPFSFELSQPVAGVADLNVQASSRIARLFSTIGVGLSMLTRKPGIAIAAAGLGLTAMPEKAVATLMPDDSDPLAYINFAQQFKGTLLWTQTSGPDGLVYGSAVRLNSEFGLTAAHVARGASGTATLTKVGNGTNFLTDPGLTIAVSSTIIDPAFDGTKQTPDLAIIRFAQPMPGNDLTIAPASVGDILNDGGFGTHGTPSTGLFPQDGNSRAFTADVGDNNVFLPHGYSASIYGLTLFGVDSNGGLLPGKGSSGDSGGPLFTGFGDLVGLNVAESGGTEEAGTNIYVNLSNSGVQGWINEETTITPEPSSLGILSLGAMGFLMRRHRR